MTETSNGTMSTDQASPAQTAPKAAWSTPAMTRLDLAMSQTLFAAIPDGDTSS